MPAIDENDDGDDADEECTVYCTADDDEGMWGHRLSGQQRVV